MKTFPRSSYAKSQFESRLARHTRNLHKIRQIIFDLPQEKEEKAGRIIEKLKKEVASSHQTNFNQEYSDMMLRTWA